MTLDSDLLTAYENADYVILTKPALILKIGEHSPRLDELLVANGAATAAFVTPANPLGERQPAAENHAAMATLEDLIAAAGYPFYPGEGRDPDGRWPAEPSFLIVGIYRSNAEALGRLFKQNAIVFAVMGKAPELVLLAV
jgi:hypothetical protein